MLEWARVYGDWAWLTWAEPGKKRFSAFRQFLKLEPELKALGIRGWLVDSEFQYVGMHKILERVGARIYGRDQKSLFFIKELL